VDRKPGVRIQRQRQRRAKKRNRRQSI